MIGVVPYVLTVSPKLPVKDLRELLALAKSKPGMLSYSSVGLRQPRASCDRTDVDHDRHQAQPRALSRRPSQAVIDLAEGRIDITFGMLGSSLPLIKDGKIKILCREHRPACEQVPDVPTLAEAGVQGFETSLWFALVGPPNLPPAIVARLNKEVNAIITDPSVMKGFDLQAMQPEPIPLDRMSNVIRNDLTRWREIAAKAGVKAE